MGYQSDYVRGYEPFVADGNGFVLGKLALRKHAGEVWTTLGALRISQDRGKWARGCRLDAGSLELAVAQVASALDVGADLMIINKFGKHEAEGRGFRAVARPVPAMPPVQIRRGQKRGHR